MMVAKAWPKAVGRGARLRHVAGYRAAFAPRRWRKDVAILADRLAGAAGDTDAGGRRRAGVPAHGWGAGSAGRGFGPAVRRAGAAAGRAADRGARPARRRRSRTGHDAAVPGGDVV